MTNSLSHRITAICMASLLLCSSTGFSIDMHYCQDQLKGVSFFGKAESCHEKKTLMPCHKSKKVCEHKNTKLSQAEKDNCCHNESIVLVANDTEVTIPQIAVQQDLQFDFIAAFVFVYIFNYSVATDIQRYKHYKPPLPDRDIQVLYQSFLI